MQKLIVEKQNRVIDLKNKLEKLTEQNEKCENKLKGLKK